MKLLMTLCFGLLIAHSGFATEAGTDIGIGFGQFSLSGDQAKGSGTGTFVRTMSVQEADGFSGGLGVELGFGSVDNSGDECCFVKDEKINIDNFGINSAILWGLGDSVLAGFEIGIHSFDLTQDNIKANYGMTKLALVSRFKIIDHWSATANFSYFLPVEEGGEETYKLGASYAYLAINYLIVPD